MLPKDIFKEFRRLERLGDDAKTMEFLQSLSAEDVEALRKQLEAIKALLDCRRN